MFEIEISFCTYKINPVFFFLIIEFCLLLCKLPSFIDLLSKNQPEPKLSVLIFVFYLFCLFYLTMGILNFIVLFSCCPPSFNLFLSTEKKYSLKHRDKK